MTGHDRDGVAELDWDALARPGQTIVIYMGLGALAHMAGRLVAHGLAPATPVAVIENGTMADERVLRGTLADIADKAGKAGIGTPSLIVVGEVTALAVAGAATPAAIATAI